MMIELRFPVELKQRGRFRVLCGNCKQSTDVPIEPDYPLPEHCPNFNCLATWYPTNGPETVAVKDLIRWFASTRDRRPDSYARLQLILHVDKNRQSTSIAKCLDEYLP